jgi:hypothetical protein
LLVFLGGLLLLGGAGSASAQTNYPLEASIELRDANGRLLDANTQTCPADGISVRSTGWAGNAAIHATFHSDPVDLGQYGTDAQGVSTFTFRVANVVNGVHTLQLDGTGANGQPRHVEAAILCNCDQVGNGGGNGAAVLGKTLDAPAGGGSVYALTGTNAGTLAMIAFTLLAIGAALRLSTSRSRVRPSGLGSTALFRRGLHGATLWAPIPSTPGSSRYRREGDRPRIPRGGRVIHPPTPWRRRPPTR